MILPDRAAPVLVADRFPDERVALLGMLRSLSPAEWSASTVCAGWSVKDVALHLLAGDLGKLARGRDGFAAPPGTVPLPSPTDFASLVKFLDALNARRVRELRWLSTPVLVDLLAATGPALHAYLAGLDPFEPGERVSWAGEAPAPNWLDVAREFTERWVHQQQIREAVGRTGPVEPHLLHPVLATFARALPRAPRDADAVAGSAVLLHVTGPAGGQWYAVREQAAWVLHEHPPSPPAATVVLDQDTAWRRFTNGIDADAARERATLTGDAALADQVLQAVAIIG